MPAIPSSALPGHKQLHERVVGSLDLCQESQSVEFKESAPWDTLKSKVVKTSLAMANLRDGGVIVVGASERGNTWDLSGIAPDDLETYDVDTVVDTVNSFGSPHVDLDIVTVAYRNGKTFLAIQAREFDKSPVVCKKAGPTGSGIEAGHVFVRPPGVAQTRRVQHASDMELLLALAAEKRAREILEQAGRVGLTARASAAEQFDRELEGL